MRQPELGKKIAEFRNLAGFTQEELSLQSKINIRTLQRIESGEATPRKFTLKVILEILGKDLNDINGENEHFLLDKLGVLRRARIYAILSAISTLLLIAFIIMRDNFRIEIAIHLTALIFIVSIVFNVFINLGRIKAGRLFDNQLLVTTGIIDIILTVLCNLSQIALIYDRGPSIALIAKSILILAALNGIFFGTGILLLKPYLNDLAFVAGIIIILFNSMFIIPIGVVEILALILMVPSFLMQALIFYRIENQQIVNPATS